MKLLKVLLVLTSVAWSIADLCVRKVLTNNILYPFITPIPDGPYYMMVARTGEVYLLLEDPVTLDIVNTGRKLAFNFEGRVSERSFRSIVWHPDYETNKKVYVYWACLPEHCPIPADDCDVTGTPRNLECTVEDMLWIGQLSEFTFEWNPATQTYDVANERSIMSLGLPDFYHGGGGMGFDKDGYLLLAIGDGAEYRNINGWVQDMTNRRGKVLRIDVDTTGGQPFKDQPLTKPYGIPSDNPYYDNDNGWRREIWATGLRQPYRCNMDSELDIFICASIGEISMETLWNIKRGENYGWAQFEGSVPFSKLSIRHITCIVVSPNKTDQNVSFHIAQYPYNDFENALAPGVTADDVVGPVFEWCRGVMCGEQARSSAIIGGGIYRGTTAPEFFGKYVAGDWGSDNKDIYMVDVAPDAPRWNWTKHEYQCVDCDDYQGHLNHVGLAHNQDILLLFNNALLRLVPSAECGIDNGVNGTQTQPEEEEQPQGWVDVPYHYRAFEEPAEISSSGGVLDLTLTVTHSRHSAGELNATHPDDVLAFNTRVYNGKFAGPTLRFRAGDTVRIQLDNQLDTIDTEYFNTWNKFTKAQLTGLHTHGLHISAEGNADNVFHEILPGDSFDYEYPIHATHAAGMNFYHSHIHGASYLQTMGGLYGAMIIDPEPSPEIQALLNLPEFIMLIGVVNSQGLSKGTSYERLTTISASTVPAALTHAFPAYQNYALVNGIFQPTVTVTANTLNNFRFTNTAGEGFLLQTSPACVMWVISQDGLYLSSPRQLSMVYLGPANRADVLFSCSAPGLYPIYSNKTSAADYLTGDLVEQTILYVQVNAGAGTTTIADINLPALPAYLPDMQTSLDFPIYQGDSVTMDYGEVMNTDKMISDTDVAEVWKVGRVYEVTITSTSFHPYHLHVNHFQIVDYKYNGGRPDLVLFKVGDRRDTVPTLAGMEVTIRFYLDTYTGKALSHCHVSHHADVGMMRLQYIVDDDLLDENDMYRTRTMYMDVPDREFKKWITTYTSDDCTLDRGPCDLSEPSSVLTKDYVDTNGDPYYRWPLAVDSYLYFVHQRGEARRETGAFMEVRLDGTYDIRPAWTVPLNPDPAITKTTYFLQNNLQIVEPGGLTDWRIFEFAFADTVPNAFPLDRGNIISTSLAFIPFTPGSILELKTLGYYRDVPLQNNVLFAQGELTLAPTPPPVPTPANPSATDDGLAIIASAAVVGVVGVALGAAALIVFSKRKHERNRYELHSVIERPRPRTGKVLRPPRVKIEG